MVLPPVAVVAVFIGFPVAAAVAYTLGRAGGPNSVVSMLAQRQTVVNTASRSSRTARCSATSTSSRDLWATIWVTLITLAVVLLLSWSIALYLRLSDTRIARIVSGLSVVPLFIPVVIASYAILVFYASDGFLRTLVHHLGWDGFPTLGYTLTCVTIGEIWVNVPFGVLMMSSGLNAVPNALIEAARDSGASLPRTVRSVLLPMNVIPTVIVATFTGIYVLGSFTVPYLTGPSAPNLMGPSMAQLLLRLQPAAAGRGDGDHRLRPRRRHRHGLRLGERPRVEARLGDAVSAVESEGVALGGLEQAELPVARPRGAAAAGWSVGAARARARDRRRARRLHGRPDRLARAPRLLGDLALPAAPAGRLDAEVVAVGLRRQNLAHSIKLCSTSRRS